MDAVSPTTLQSLRVAGRLPLGGILWTLIRTDFKTRYHGTIGGFVWALLKPAAMFAVLLGVFSFVFQSQPKYRLNLIIGLFLYDFFSEATKTGFVSLQAKAYLLTKVKFPISAVVVTSISNALLTLVILSTVIFATLGMTGAPPSLAHAALYVWYVLHYIVIVVGISLAASVLFLRYRDLNQFWEVVIQAGFFVAPIIYPLGIIPERYHLFLYFWPPTPIIQFSRAVLVEHTVPTLKAHGLLSLFSLLILGIGAAVFRRYSPRAAEYL